MTEKEKMIAGEYYDPSDAELTKARFRAQHLCFRFNCTNPKLLRQRFRLLRKLIHTEESFYIEQPFRCDYGFNISVGKNFYSNYNLCILDCNKVTIGDDVMIAPNVSIYTATHPTDPVERCERGGEFGRPVNIGNRVWIGGGVTILPGVTIGENTVVGAGSVVNQDLPANVIAAGNPARVIKAIDREE